MADEQQLKCRRCGDDHDLFACPHVKALEFEGGWVMDAGQPFLRRVEFLTPADLVARRVDAAGEAQPDYPRKNPR